ncbi:hypothetical protein TSTA_122930 [Talaromyces stipitatus ATCC 10500]|uniref:Mid2 domain-containing protein n=1 Tax=Talaromyces stipitatus (strain ATCC 10500 / CBS 375.48 / QM 6759 / NRRL 1006) TaxID=441959 RepID=B8MCB8_TALSN|nr:uncharacterized protein TSTA_122930 [Talaromyces stipitatus ATCC 10500]EED18564.1 hypothetical protein TSTA_122930 [Talaromyces stipitatus ATCC 10500]
MELPASLCFATPLMIIRLWRFNYQGTGFGLFYYYLVLFYTDFLSNINRSVAPLSPRLRLSLYELTDSRLQDFSLSTIAIPTASASIFTNTIPISNGQVTTVTITYAPAATSSAGNTTAISSPSDTPTSGNSGDSSSSGSSISSNAQKSSSGLSTGAKIGIGVGAGVGGLAIIGGIIALIVYCCARRRRETTAVGTNIVYAPANNAEDDKADAPVVTPIYHEHKPELDSQQQEQRLQQQVHDQQHNPAGLAAPVSPVSDDPSSTTGRTSELHSESQGYYQSPDGGAQELGAVSSYQHHYQYHLGVVTQAEMPADQGQGHGNTRHELQ